MGARDSKKTTWLDPVKEIRYLTLHHTATDHNISIEDMKQSMVRTHWRVPSHFVIDKWWNYEQTAELTENVWATLNEYNNTHSIQIEIIGNFNYKHPTFEQYKAVNDIYFTLKKQYPKIQVKTHKEVWATQCPWKFFDVSMIWKKLKAFSMSRYYSVIQNQQKYYLGKTYEEDFAMNCHWDCTSTAMWYKLSNKDKNKVVACPTEIPLWTKLHIVWMWTVTCVDRGWAIKKNWEEYRIDNYCWVWDFGRQWIEDNTCITNIIYNDERVQWKLIPRIRFWYIID